jgi:3-deoxy-D-manno-octulosonate 8-phosphate phosphatase (KDO 8-P phosphatase)
MSKTYKERLTEITTMIFDIDGVFTDGMVHVMPDGQLLRKLSVKDSYALQYAIKKGVNIAIITGGNSIAIHDSLQRLGVKHIFLKSKNKEQVFDTFVQKLGITAEQVLYMGDDIPDFRVMEKAGVAACPADASEEIKQISDYVSNRNGGGGCVRDIIEQTLKVQGLWFDDDAHEW